MNSTAPMSDEERRKRLAAVYSLLLEVAAGKRARGAQAADTREKNQPEVATG